MFKIIDRNHPIVQILGRAMAIFGIPLGLLGMYEAGFVLLPALEGVMSEALAMIIALTLTVVFACLGTLLVLVGHKIWHDPYETYD